MPGRDSTIPKFPRFLRKKTLCGRKAAVSLVLTAVDDETSINVAAVYQWGMRLVTDKFLCSFTGEFQICSERLRGQYILKEESYLSHIKTSHQDRTGVTVISHTFEYRGALCVVFLITRLIVPPLSWFLDKPQEPENSTHLKRIILFKPLGRW